MVKLVDLPHSAIELRELRVVKLSISEGDYEGWGFVTARKTGFDAYWQHCQALDRIGIPRVGREQLFLACSSRMQLCAEVFSKWEPFGSPSVFHLAMVELVDMLHSAVELRELRVVKLSIVEGDYEGWGLLSTRKTGFGAYWHHRQSLDRIGIPRV